MTTAELNRDWSQTIIETCLRSVASHFFVAPGSRSTPLTAWLGDLPRDRVTTHFDERGLAFACLGYGRTSGGVGVIICTSGTAVANLLPAVVEASLDRVPLLILSADRPPELRDTGANQTIRQPQLFGIYPIWSFDLPCPSPEVSLAFVRSTIGYGLERCRLGPVHINCMFREPLFATPASETGLAAVPAVDATATDPPTAQVFPLRLPGGSTVVVAGGGTRPQTIAAKRLAEQIQAVFISDVTSQLHAHSLDLALLNERLPHPETVIHIGQRIVSKQWYRFLAESPNACHIHISRFPDRMDPNHSVTQRVPLTLQGPLPDVHLDRPCPPDFQQAWHRALTEPRSILAEEFASAAVLTEPFVAYTVAEQLVEGSACYLGNSMPVRDMDAFGCWPDDRDVIVTANRGASGIDGTLASATGLATGSNRPTIAVLGDLAFLHDLNSLALVRSCRQPVTVVVVNNNGGGIFHFLPIAEQSSHFESLFAMPHGLRDLSAAAALFDIPYCRPEQPQDFRDVLRYWNARQGPLLIEIVTDRRENVDYHRQLRNRLRRVG